MTRADQNPFRTSRLLSLPTHWGSHSCEALLARWQAAGRRGALVGPHGTGKTTRLRALAASLATRGWRVVWIQWHDDGTSTPAHWRDKLRDCDARTVVCLDGSENLGLFSSYPLHRRIVSAGGVLATLHRASRRFPTLAWYAPDPELFADHAELLAPGCGRLAREAFAATGGNAHEAFRRLYLSAA